MRTRGKIIKDHRQRNQKVGSWTFLVQIFDPSVRFGNRSCSPETRPQYLLLFSVRRLIRKQVSNIINGLKTLGLIHIVGIFVGWMSG